MDRDPYEIDPPELPGRDSEAWRRYQRSRRLVQFRRDLASWARAGLLSHPRYVDKIRYRRESLERWEAFLDGWTPTRTRQSGDG
jgi:hypothetical protein